MSPTPQRRLQSAAFVALIPQHGGPSVLMGNAGDEYLAGERLVSDAFRKAVAREHQAITVHEHAAAMHDAVAERLEAMADVESDPDLAARRREDAAVERTRAENARARAAAARKRLSEEGEP